MRSLRKWTDLSPLYSNADILTAVEKKLEDLRDDRDRLAAEVELLRELLRTQTAERDKPKIRLLDNPTPAVRIRRVFDNAEKDFFYNSEGVLPLDEIIKWTEGDPRVVTFYDHGPNKIHYTPKTVSEQPPLFKKNGEAVILTNERDSASDELEALNKVLSAEVAALRKAMISALIATRATVDETTSTEFLCLGGDEIKKCIERLTKERDAALKDLWCAEDRWGKDYMWKTWKLSRLLTDEWKKSQS